LAVYLYNNVGVNIWLYTCIMETEIYAASDDTLKYETTA